MASDARRARHRGMEINWRAACFHGGFWRKEIDIQPDRLLLKMTPANKRGALMIIDGADGFNHATLDRKY